MELADLIIVNKADGELLPAARRACSDLRKALHLLRPKRAGWEVEVRTGSALNGDGVPELWEAIVDFHARLSETGEHDLLPARPDQAAMGREATDSRIDRLRASPGRGDRRGRLPPTAGAGVTHPPLPGDGGPELWESIVDFHARHRETGELDLLRARQAQAAMWSEVNDTLIDRLRASPGVRERLGELEAAVAAGDISPTAAAHDVLERFLGPD